MAKFLTREQAYRILQRELPEGVYPDGAPSGYYSTADMDSVADVVATGYANLERIYANYFPQTSDEYIGKWVEKMFIGVSFDSSVSLQELRDRVIAKIRKRPTIAMWEVAKLVAGYVPEGTYIQIFEYGCHDGFWKLGVSKLGKTTVFGFDNEFQDLGVDASDWCAFVKDRQWKLGVSKLGIDTILNEYSYAQIIEPQMRAFGYEVRIFGYEITGTSLDQLVKQIRATEPARSVHYLRQNLNLADFGLNTTVNDVDEFSLVNCITRDPSSLTGYSGRI